ncbi:MAG: 3-deoxy-D-manno-octulosonic acid transferase [Desulfuromonadales bacterium]|nr:3-deoxy-D-manno-octulosonic acid transferase [Desulfuromonadales bacterium]
MYLLYDLILLLAGLFLVPYAFFKGLSYGNSFAGIRQRLGFFSSAELLKLRGSKVFWVHAVSVGEVRASQPLIKSLKERYPDCKIVLSGMTFTGNQIARTVAGVDLVIFFPFDFSAVVKRALKALKPTLVVIIETELWPNFIRQVHQNRIPLVLANGRISRKSFPRYLGIRKIIQPLLKKFSVLAMQNSACARRIKALGAPGRLVQVTGNMKFDLPLSVPEMSDLLRNGELERLLRGKFVWVAGSIRSGEAEILLGCHQQLIEQGIPSFPILAPRHPQRCGAIAELLKKENLPFVLRSELESPPPGIAKSQLLLVDTVGELTRFYALAQAIFVGGSLVPKGGHNMLEPAQQGKPVLFGPHVFNFKEISQMLLEAGAGLKVKSGEDLVKSLVQLYDDKNLCQAMGQAGQELIRGNAGATGRTLASISELLES